MSEDWARPVVHFEIEALDAEAQRAFYQRMFGWSIGPGPSGPSERGTPAIMQIPAGIGGPEPGPGGHIRQGGRSGVSLYVQVRDLNASLAQTAELGGSVDSEPFDVPGGPRIAFVRDPEGNPLVLVQQ